MQDKYMHQRRRGSITVVRQSTLDRWVREAMQGAKIRKKPSKALLKEEKRQRMLSRKARARKRKKNEETNRVHEP